MRKRRAAQALAAVAMASLLVGARSYEPILHEPIPPDPREDLAMRVSLAGELPAALETGSGIVSAPDPQRLPSPLETAYGISSIASYAPDRETRRARVGAYDDPFTPSTAPFKRMQSFDSVGADGKLHVFDERRVPVAVDATPLAGDDFFYANLVVDLAPRRSVRIPSVGPGARILRASLSRGAEAIPFLIFRDGAENWSLESPGVHAPLEARLVMEVAVPRAVFGGPIAKVGWDRLPPAPPLPPNVAREATQVRSAIGVSRELPPRDALAKLVTYFRGFEASDEPPQGRGSVFLDLALSKKGVCRHRSFAFVVTALSLGIPARFVMNETHAWVEAFDGAVWKRIDLGGAGTMPSASSSETGAPPYESPVDAFAWPRSGQRAVDMVGEVRSGGASFSKETRPSLSADQVSAPSKGVDADGDTGDRSVRIVVADAAPHRGQPLHVSGEFLAGGRACAHAAVDFFLRDVRTAQTTLLGTLATRDDGTFAGSVVVPESLGLGPYDIVARASRGEACGALR